MNTKGAVGVILGIIAGVLILVLLIVLVIVAKQKIFPSNEEIQKNQTTVRLFLGVFDKETEESLIANYLLVSNQNTILSEGVLDKDKLTESRISYKGLLTFSCWNNDYYSDRISQTISESIVDETKFTLFCNLYKIDKDLKVSHQGNLNEELNTIKLNITAKEKFRRVSLCFSWTTGIIDVILPDFFEICDGGAWRNYSFFNTTSEKYLWLPKEQYICSQSPIQECEEIIGNRCKLKEIIPPLRHRSISDVCVYTGKNINNGELNLEFQVKTSDFKNPLDFLEIIVVDYDLRFNKEQKKWEWVSEKNGVDIGAEDILYLVEYQS